MVRPLGQINAPQVMAFVPGIDVADCQRGDDLAGRIDQGRLLPRLEAAGQFGVTGNAMGMVQAYSLPFCCRIDSSNTRR